MLFKLWWVLVSLFTSHFQAPVDDEYPYVIPGDISYDDTPQGPLSWKEIEQAAHALYGQGNDILYPEDNGRSYAGIKGKGYRWPNKTIPIVMSRDVINDKPLLRLFDTVRRYIEKETDIKIVPRKKEQHYALLMKDGDTCNSYVGCLQMARQPVSLGVGCNHTGIVMHELLHLIGLGHEHQRSDRDNWVIIHPQNVKPGEMVNFDKNNPNDEETFGLQYNYDSIMHYGSTAWSKDLVHGLKTMEAKNGRPLKDPWEKTVLTDEDRELVRKMYA